MKKDIEEQIILQVPIKTPVQLEDEVELINNVIQYAAWVSSPSIYTGSKNQNYPLEVSELVREKLSRGLERFGRELARRTTAIN